jgi:transposase
MTRKTNRAPLVLSPEEQSMLQTLSASRTAAKREVERAGILLRYSRGEEISALATAVGVSRPTAYLCIDKALGRGVTAGLKDEFHRPHEPTITPEARTWVVQLACTKPTAQGLAAETWTISALARYVVAHCAEHGHDCLAQAGKSTIWRILNEAEIKPHRIRYYLERRDPDFEVHMHEVLMVYREVALQSPPPNAAQTLYTVSVDEKPGIQAIGNTAPDRPPVPGKHSSIGRDHEYKRHGTVSLLAALDLHDGYIIGQVHERHRSREFIELLKALDVHYPAEARIRVILDNHSAHISKETRGWLATRPNRFEYVHTPKHGSWLNIIEMLFSKMARGLLRHMRVASKAELKQRILQGIEELNRDPVVFRWAKFDLVIT